MKTILITGADGNLGGAVTRAFLDAGYRVLATVLNDDARKSVAAHDQLDVQAVNLANETETGEFIASAIARYGRIDGALLLVGGFAMGDIASTGGALLKKMYALNFETAYYAMRPLLAHMRASGKGRLVFIGSRPALQPADGKAMIAYALSKSLLFSLADCINQETKGTNVVATVVVPSTLDTDINRQAMPDADHTTWVRPQQVADIMKFICSEAGDVLRETVLKVYNNA